jgi:hypothetical protein
MVILVVPMFSQSMLNADSDYHFISRLLPAILKSRPEWLFDVIWPSNQKDWRYYNDGFFEDPRIRRSPLYLDPNKMRQVVSFDARGWLHFLDYKKNVYDAILTNTVEFGDLLRCFTPFFDDGGKSYVMNFHHYVLHDSLNYPVERTYEHILLRQIIASLNVDTNIVNSDHCAAMLLDNAEKYLRPTHARRIRDSIVKVPYGMISRARVKKLQQPRHETFTFAYNHRLQDYKQWRKTFAMFGQLWQRHPGKFRVQLHAAIASDRVSEVNSLPFVDVIDKPGYDDYLAALSRCHANVTHSLHETFSISCCDSMSFGQTLIAPNGVTFPEITGKKRTKYPMLFNNDDEAFAHAERCMLDPMVWAEWGQVLQDWVTSHYQDKHTAAAMIELIEKGTAVEVLSKLKRRKEFVDVIGQQQSWQIDDLRQEMYRVYSDVGKRLASSQSFPVLKLKRIANELGYTDRWTNRGLSLERQP